MDKQEMEKNGIMTLVELEHHVVFGGVQKRYRHYSNTLGCEMVFSVYLPPHHEKTTLPVLYCLSGLTCNDQNFATKSGAQQYAAETGIMLVMPDTSCRGRSVTDDPAYDLGQGAGFYVDAIQEPWKKHYRMFTYTASELPALIHDSFKVNGKQSMLGHSMGGHGALMLALRYSGRFRSVSAFAPVVTPTQVPWGQKAFSAYLGKDKKLWQAYDSCFLMERYQGTQFPLLIDQGTEDEFLGKELQPEKLEAIAMAKAWPLILRWQKGYDHSYYFITSFMRDHILFHSEHLK